MHRRDADAEPRAPAKGARLGAMLFGGAILGLAARQLAARRRGEPGAPLARIRRSVAIAAPAEAAYALLVNADAISRLSPEMAVTAHSPNRWLWTVRLPAGLSARIETVMTDARPGRRLALRSVHGSAIPLEAEFDLFPAADSGETIVTALVTLERTHRLPAMLVERPARLAADRAVAGLLSGLRAALEDGQAPTAPRLTIGADPDREAPASDEPDQVLGRVVYGDGPRPVAAEPAAPADADALVEEALQESFPASDAPGYAAGATIDPGGNRDAAAGKG